MKEFHGYAIYDICGKENVYCNSLKKSYQILHIVNCCEKCDKKISKGAKLDNYKPKHRWQVIKAKAIILNLHAKYLKRRIEK